MEVNTGIEVLSTLFPASSSTQCKMSLTFGHTLCADMSCPLQGMTISSSSFHITEKLIKPLCQSSRELREAGPCRKHHPDRLSQHSRTPKDRDVLIVLPLALESCNGIKSRSMDSDESRKDQKRRQKENRAASRQLRRERKAAKRQGQRKEDTSSAKPRSSAPQSNIRRGSRARRPPPHLNGYKLD